MKISGRFNAKALRGLRLTPVSGSRGSNPNPGGGGSGPPPKPPLADSMFWTASTSIWGHANTAARQVSLEPSNAGVDVPFSWAFWIRPSNLKGMDQSQRVVVCGPTTSTNFSYTIGINPKSTQTASQVLSINLQTSAGNSIGCYTPTKLLSGRVSHVVITYDGSEVNTGLKMYVNGVSIAVNYTSAGSYTGLANDASARIQIGSVFTGAVAFSGDLKDIIFIKGLALSQAQVTELYNGGIPGTVTGVSFYGSITAYYPCAVNLNCLNDGSLNMSSVTNIASRSTNFGVSYESLSLFNSYPANNRYLAFGNIMLVGSEVRIYQCSGTSHLLNKYIVKMVYNKATLECSAPVIVLNELPTNSLNSLGNGFINDSFILLGSAKFNNPTFLELDTYLSTDGSVGEVFGSAVPMANNLPGYNWYGQIIRRPGFNTWWGAEPEAIAGSNYRWNLWSFDVSGVGTKTTPWTGAPGLSLGEPALLWVNSNTLFAVCRSESSLGLYFMYSTDGAVTWSAPAAMGFGSGICNAAMCLDPNGNVVLVYMDRGVANAGVYISVANDPATVMATPTAWNVASKVMNDYSGSSLSPLGYPSIVREGYIYYIAISAEFSSSRADQLLAVGRLD